MKKPRALPPAAFPGHASTGGDNQETSRRSAQKQAASEQTISGLIDGCERAVFQYQIEDVHRRRVVDLGLKLIVCAGYAGDDLIHVDPGLRDHMQLCLADIEDRLALALKQYRKLFSHVGVELNAWGPR
jgi:hypothetical protein